VALGRAAAGRAMDRGPFEAVAAAIGEAAAHDAAAVAANFEIMNRVVDAVGLRVGTHQRQEKADLVELLGLDQFPGARH
jgi:2,3-bisphosphoglycerate-independent phosphoglycerate mutase